MIPVNRPLSELHQVNWTELEHAYGPADDVPDLLRALASEDTDTREDARYALYGNIWHQGTVYSSTAYAVPFILGLPPELVAENAELLLELANGSGYVEVHCPEGPKSTPEELEAMQQERQWVSSAREAVLAGLPLYQGWLDHADAEVRLSMVKLLAHLSGDCPEAMDWLETRLRKESAPTVQGWILWSRVAATESPTIEEVLTAAQSKSPSVRLANVVSAVRRLTGPESWFMSPGPLADLIDVTGGEFLPFPIAFHPETLANQPQPKSLTDLLTVLHDLEPHPVARWGMAVALVVLYGEDIPATVWQTISHSLQQPAALQPLWHDAEEQKLLAAPITSKALFAAGRTGIPLRPLIKARLADTQLGSSYPSRLLKWFERLEWLDEALQLCVPARHNALPEVGVERLAQLLHLFTGLTNHGGIVYVFDREALDAAQEIEGQAYRVPQSEQEDGLRLRLLVTAQLPQFLPLIRHPDARLRAAMVNLLGEYAPEVPELAGQLTERLDIESDPRVLAHLLHSLGNYPGGVDAEHMKAALRSPHAAVRLAAVRTVTREGASEGARIYWPVMALAVQGVIELPSSVVSWPEGQVDKLTTWLAYHHAEPHPVVRWGWALCLMYFLRQGLPAAIQETLKNALLDPERLAILCRTRTGESWTVIEVDDLSSGLVSAGRASLPLMPWVAEAYHQRPDSRPLKYALEWMERVSQRDQQRA